MSGPGKLDLASSISQEPQRRTSMFGKVITTVGIAMLVSVASASAQQRGTLEFGAFGAVTSFGGSTGMGTGVGVGGRVSAYLHPIF
jgi:hypothetical protein